MAARELPSELVAGRFFVRPLTRAGHELALFTDTGGGLFVYSSVVDRLGLRTELVTVEGESLTVTSLPEFDPDAAIPAVAVEDDPRDTSLRGRLIVLPEKARALDVGDGVLGHAWFGGRAWTFDYAGGRLLLHDTSPLRAGDAHVIPTGFRTDAAGRRVTHFPSIEATIAGEKLDFLFDTGATVRLSGHARDRLGDGGPAERATSFVIASVFDRWRHRFRWRVIDGADENAAGQAAIEVPQVSIAGHTVGPVWFTRRPDDNFRQWMSSMMDRQVDGALGGSLLQHFVVTADYPRSRIRFEKVA